MKFWFVRLAPTQLSIWTNDKKSPKIAKTQRCSFLLSSLQEDRTFGSVTLWFTEFAPKEGRQNPNVTSSFMSLCHVQRVSQPTDVFSFKNNIIQSSFPFNRKHSCIICHNRLRKLHIFSVSETTDRLRSVISDKFHTYIRNTRKVLKCVAGEGWRGSLGPIVWEIKLSQWGEWTHLFQVRHRKTISLRCKGFI